MQVEVSGPGDLRRRTSCSATPTAPRAAGRARTTGRPGGCCSSSSSTDGSPTGSPTRSPAALFGWADDAARRIGAERGLDAQQIDSGAFADDAAQHRWLERAGFDKVRTWWQMSPPGASRGGRPRPRGARGRPDPAGRPAGRRDARRGGPAHRPRHPGGRLRRPLQLPRGDLRRVPDPAARGPRPPLGPLVGRGDRRRRCGGRPRARWWPPCREGSAGAPDGSYVEYIGVLQNARGRGVAKSLLRTVIADAAARGRDRVGLEVDADSPTGRRRALRVDGLADQVRHRVLAPHGAGGARALTDLVSRVGRRLRRSLAGLRPPRVGVVVVVQGVSTGLDACLDALLASPPAAGRRAGRRARRRRGGPARRRRRGPGTTRPRRRTLPGRAVARRGRRRPARRVRRVRGRGRRRARRTRSPRWPRRWTRSGSDVALGVRVEVRGDRRRRVPWAGPVLRPATATTLEERPGPGGGRGPGRQAVPARAVAGGGGAPGVLAGRARSRGGSAGRRRGRRRRRPGGSRAATTGRCPARCRTRTASVRTCSPSGGRGGRGSARCWRRTRSRCGRPGRWGCSSTCCPRCTSTSSAADRRTRRCCRPRRRPCSTRSPPTSSRGSRWRRGSAPGWRHTAPRPTSPCCRTTSPTTRTACPPWRSPGGPSRRSPPA